MNAIKQQFYKITEQYFLNNDEDIVQTKNYSSATKTRKFYIKEIPLDHTGDIKYK